MASLHSSGASLEECLTNTFKLAETYCLRWRCYRANPLIPVIPEQDPVLSSYSSLLDAGFLCAWQKSGVIKTNDETPPKCEKELWVFWYDKEPKGLREKIHSDLTANDSTNDDNIKYEYKTIFYKALHNSIERHLLKQNYVRLDKWFLKPFEDVSEVYSNKEHFSFCFSFFLHGDSNVCASVDVTRHFPIRRITSEHVSLASRNPNSVNVMLAPHCLKATLTGVAYKMSDDSAIFQLIEQWNRYYPLKMPSVDSEDNLVPESENNTAPAAVEVLVGDVIMCYPSWMVVIATNEDPLIKQIDDVKSNVLPAATSSAGLVSKTKGAILTTTQTDKNALLMINSGLKSLSIDPLHAKFGTTDPITGKCNFTGNQPGALGRACLCCNSRNSRKALGRRDRHSPFHSSHFHQRNRSVDKKGSQGSGSNGLHQEGRLSSDMNTISPNKGTASNVISNAGSITGLASDHNRLSVKPVNLDPGSYPIMNGLLGLSSCEAPPCSVSDTSKSCSSLLDRSYDSVNGQTADGKGGTDPQSRNVQMVIYPGKFQPTCKVSTEAGDSDNAVLPLLNRLKHSKTHLDRLYSGCEAEFGCVASNWLEELGCDQSRHSIFGSQTSSSVYDFDDRMDFTESYSDAIHSNNSGGKRGRGGASRRGSGRGKDPNNQVQRKTGKKRKGKNDIDSPGSEVNTNVFPSSMQPSMNASLAGLVNGKPKTPTQMNKNAPQLTSPVGSLTTTRSLELTKAEFVENTFESSDEEEMPSILDPSYLSTFNGDQDQQPPSVKQPDSVELARMFPTPPSNNPPDICPNLGTNVASSPQNMNTNSPFLHLNNTSGGNDPSKLMHGYGHMLQNGSVDQGAGMADWSLVLAAAGLETRTLVVPEKESNPPPSGSQLMDPSSHHHLNCSVQSTNSSNMSQSCDLNNTQEDDWTRVVCVKKMVVFEQPDTYDRLCLTPPVLEEITSLGTMSKRRKWDLTTESAFLNPKKFSYCVGRRRRLNGKIDIASNKSSPDVGGANQSSKGMMNHSSPGASDSMVSLNTPANVSSATGVGSANLSGHEPMSVQFGSAPTPQSVVNSQSPATPHSVPVHTPGGSLSAIGAPFSHGAATTTTDINSPLSCQSLARTPFGGLYGGSSGYASIGPLSCSTMKPPASMSSLGGTHSLLVNLYLSDSLLNIFTDINFDSCVICNCHLTIQSKDASLYLSGTPVALDASKTTLNGSCECGFSALRNRHLAAGAGLFGEDEFEVVSRTTYRRDKTLLPWQSSHSLIRLINEQLTSTCSLLPKFNLTTVLCVDKKLYRNTKPKKLQFTQRELDGRLSIKEAIHFSKFTVENPAPATAIDIKKLRFDDWLLQRDHSIVYSNEGTLSKSMASAVAAVGREIKEVCSHFATDCAPKADGPLTWAQFYKHSGVYTAQDLKPLPVPSLMVATSDHHNTSVSPFALSYWEKMVLEPFSGSRTVFYIAVCPNDATVIEGTRRFLRELSSVYQTCQMGVHVPAQVPSSSIGGLDHLDIMMYQKSGILVVRDSTSAEEKKEAAGSNGNMFPRAATGMPQGADSDWWNTLANSTQCREKLLSFASSCQSQLKHLIENVNFEPSGGYFASLNANHSGQEGVTIKEEYGCQNESNAAFNNNVRSGEFHNGYLDGSSPFKEPLSTVHSPTMKTEDSSTIPATNSMEGSPISSGSQMNRNKSQPSTLVIYMIDPFSHMNSNKTTPSNASVASSLACLKTFQTIVEKLPEHLQQKCMLQLLPLSTVNSFTSWRNYAMNRKLLKAYCFSIYSKCSTNLLRLVPCKSLTSFGPSADKSGKYAKYGLKATTFTPPYTLMPTKITSDSNSSTSHQTLNMVTDFANNDATNSGQDTNVLFVTYCLSHDHRWILVTCTDLIGQILHVNTINVESVTPSSSTNRRRSSTAKQQQQQQMERRGAGLEKVWEFVLSVISTSAMCWRVVIGRFGRLGHGEIKDWQTMLSKLSLSKYSQSLKSVCTTCKLQAEACSAAAANGSSSCSASILSVCLVSLEAASHLQLFHDPLSASSGNDGSGGGGLGGGSSSKKTNSQSSLSSSTSGLSAAFLSGLSGGTREVSCTHVLVIPTSANTQQVTNTPQTGLDVQNDLEILLPDVFTFLDEDHQDDIGQLMSELDTDANNPLVNAGGKTGGPGDSDDLANMSKKAPCTAYLPLSEGDAENFQLQQQPLALGFYVSTAPTGQLPSWFWSANPLAEFRDPATLKAALHITTSMNDDRQKQPHPLDSHHTTTVLRHVLESYNSLSWLNVDPFYSFDRSSCLPVHMVVLVNLYHCMEKFSTLSLTNSPHNHLQLASSSTLTIGAEISPNTQIVNSTLSQQHLSNRHSKTS